jgi:hypothetical protein
LNRAGENNFAVNVLKAVFYEGKSVSVNPGEMPIPSGSAEIDLGRR